MEKFADHEVIVPRNVLRKAWAQGPAKAGAEDPVAAAEKALAALSGEFADWMASESERLDTARRAIAAQGFDAARRTELFHAAHDIKGQAATFGFPLAAEAAAGLCRLIERTPEGSRIPLVLVDQHVDAVRAIVREHDAPAADATARALVTRLREVSDAFLRDIGAPLDDDDAPPTAPR
ncbi:Hpt domain protein [Rhodovulum sp. PH10]|nr:Hpt domain protein [Rhodovulum sp. PH10]